MVVAFVGGIVCRMPFIGCDSEKWRGKDADALHPRGNSFTTRAPQDFIHRLKR